MDHALQIIALVLFAIAIPPLPLKFNAVAAGLFCLTLTLVI